MHRRTQEDETRARRVFVCCLTLPQPSSSQLQEEIIATQAQLVFNVLGPGTRDGPLFLLSNDTLPYPGKSRSRGFTHYWAFDHISQHRPVKRQNINNARHTTGHSSHVTAHRPRAVRSPLSGYGKVTDVLSAGRAAHSIWRIIRVVGPRCAVGLKYTHTRTPALYGLSSLYSH